MDKQKIQDFAKRRQQIFEWSQDEDYVGLDALWDELSDFIAADIPGAIKFMCDDPDCNDEIFSDWSEVFDDVARKTQSREFVDALKVAAKRFPKACEDYNIAGSIEFAEYELQD